MLELEMDGITAWAIRYNAIELFNDSKRWIPLPAIPVMTTDDTVVLRYGGIKLTCKFLSDFDAKNFFTTLKTWSK